MKPHQSFSEGRARGILPAPLPGKLGLKKRLIGSRQQLRRIVCCKQRLPDRIRTRRQRRIVPWTVSILPVVQEDDPSFVSTGGGPTSGNPLSNLPATRPHQHLWLAIRALHRRPMHQIVRCRQVNLALAPVHPVAAVQS